MWRGNRRSLLGIAAGLGGIAVTRPSWPAQGSNQYVTETAAVIDDLQESADATEASVLAMGNRLDLLQLRQPTICALGDSITSNGINNGGAGAVNWLMYACIASKG